MIDIDYLEQVNLMCSRIDDVHFYIGAECDRSFSNYSKSPNRCKSLAELNEYYKYIFDSLSIFNTPDFIELMELFVNYTKDSYHVFSHLTKTNIKNIKNIDRQVLKDNAEIIDICQLDISLKRLFDAIDMYSIQCILPGVTVTGYAKRTIKLKGLEIKFKYSCHDNDPHLYIIIRFPGFLITTFNRRLTDFAGRCFYDDGYIHNPSIETFNITSNLHGHYWWIRYLYYTNTLDVLIDKLEMTSEYAKLKNG